MQKQRIIVKLHEDVIKDGYCGKRNKKFNANSVSVIVKNTTYISYNKFHELYKKNHHKAIISKRLFNKCNNIKSS